MVNGDDYFDWYAYYYLRLSLLLLFTTDSKMIGSLPSAADLIHSRILTFTHSLTEIQRLPTKLIRGHTSPRILKGIK